MINAAAASFGVNSYSYTFGYTARHFIDRLADRGHQQFELMLYPGHLWPKDLSASDRNVLRRHITARELDVITLNMPNIDVNIAAASPDVRALSLDLLERGLQLAGDLGARGLVVGVGKANPLFAMPRAELLGHFHRAIERLLPIAAKAGVGIWVENMPFSFIASIDDVLAAVDRYSPEDIGIVYDVANAHFIKEDIVAGLQACKPRLRLVHLSDTRHDVYRHDPIGHGSVPFETLPTVLKAVGYTGRPMLEVISAEADVGIDTSVQRLSNLGFAKPMLPVTDGA